MAAKNTMKVGFAFINILELA